MRVEEKSAIGERKLECGFGGVLWTMRALVWMRFVRVMGMMGFVGVMRILGVTRLVWVMGLVRVVRMVRRFGPTRVVRGFGPIRVVRRLRSIRVMRRLRSIRVMGFAVSAMISPPAGVFDLLWFRPLSVLVALELFVRIKSGP